jgi:hypothetical protein
MNRSEILEQVKMLKAAGNGHYGISMMLRNAGVDQEIRQSVMDEVFGPVPELSIRQKTINYALRAELNAMIGLGA